MVLGLTAAVPLVVVVVGLPLLGVLLVNLLGGIILFVFPLLVIPLVVVVVTLSKLSSGCISTNAGNSFAISDEKSHKSWDLSNFSDIPPHAVQIIDKELAMGNIQSSVIIVNGR